MHRMIERFTLTHVLSHPRNSDKYRATHPHSILCYSSLEWHRARADEVGDIQVASSNILKDLGLQRSLKWGLNIRRSRVLRPVEATDCSTLVLPPTICPQTSPVTSSLNIRARLTSFHHLPPCQFFTLTCLLNTWILHG